MAQPSVNACAVDECAPEPPFLEAFRPTLPPHAHVLVQAKRWRATWSTPATVWTVELTNAIGSNRPNVAVTDSGSGFDNRWTFGPTPAGDVVSFLRGAYALAHHNPDVRGYGDGVPGWTGKENLGDLLRPFLPEHTKFTSGERRDHWPLITFNQTRVERNISTLRLDVHDYFTATWTTPVGQWDVQLNPADPHRRGLFIHHLSTEDRRGNWHFPEPDPVSVVSFLRGAGGIEHHQPSPSDEFIKLAVDQVRDIQKAVDAHELDRLRQADAPRRLAEHVAGRSVRYEREMRAATGLRDAARRVARLAQEEIEEATRG